MCVQVIKTCEKLRELKFHSIRMIEVRQRPYDARYVSPRNRFTAPPWTCLDALVSAPLCHGRQCMPKILSVFPRLDQASITISGIRV
jgi:hypothetical protein